MVRKWRKRERIRRDVKKGKKERREREMHTWEEYTRVYWDILTTVGRPQGLCWDGDCRPFCPHILWQWRGLEPRNCSEL